MQNENFYIWCAKFIKNLDKVFLCKRNQVSSNEGQHLYSRGESNCKIDKSMDNFSKKKFQEKFLL